MTTLRLCFIVESGTDVRLVEGLAERFDLTILARRIVDGVEISHAPALPVQVIVGPASRFRFALLVWQQLWRRRGRIDCVIVQGYSIAALAANLAGRFTGTPAAMLVCSPLEAYYRCRQEHPQPGKPFRWLELWAMQALARLNAIVGQQYIVLSNHLADVIRHHGARRKMIDVVPVYGVDTKLFTPPHEPKAAIKARLGLPTSGSLIFFSSRIAPEKDGEALLEAVRKLLAEGRDLWLLHRSGGYRAFLKDAERYGIADRVIATDAVHPHGQLPDDYRACDLCVQASRAEGLGFSPLEALACGVPVVAAGVGGLKETIVEGQTGWTYPAGDAAALAHCIAAALDDPVEASRRAAAGRASVCARYDRRAVFSRLVEILSARNRRDESESSAQVHEQPATVNQRRSLREEADSL